LKLYFTDNGPCLGWKPSPKEPYKWITYNDVSILYITNQCYNSLQGITILEVLLSWQVVLKAGRLERLLFVICIFHFFILPCYQQE